MSKHNKTNKSGGKDQFSQVMADFKRGVLKSSDGKPVTDSKNALTMAMSAAGISKSDLNKAEVINKARVFKSQLEVELKKELSNEKSVVKDIYRYFKSVQVPKMNDIQKEMAEKYKIDKGEVTQFVLQVAKSIIEKARVVGGYESPEPGDLPEEGKKILASAYASCRKDGGDKEKCSKIAWTAVNKAGYKSMGIAEPMVKKEEEKPVEKVIETQRPKTKPFSILET